MLRDIALSIPEGKTTALVGASGSCKTTLMKLLLKFYEPVRGGIQVNGHDLGSLSPGDLRHHCGVVMQDGYLFSDTLERNIATGQEEIDYERLDRALRIANIRDFVESLPLSLKTKLGAAFPAARSSASSSPGRSTKTPITSFSTRRPAP